MIGQRKATTAQAGDLVQLAGLGHRNFIITLEPGANFHTHRGVIAHDDLIGKPWGSPVHSHTGSPFYLLPPSLADLLRGIKRSTQILYPKDIGYIITMLGIGPGSHVVEAGSGSGALTTALAYAVGKDGKVSSFDSRAELQATAVANIAKFGFTKRVDFYSRDILEGFTCATADALFLDLPNPYDYLEQVRKVLLPGGYFGCILPTTNQVSDLLRALRSHHFAFIDVCEIIHRFYRADPEKLRPSDRMVAHTGYLIFARPIIPMQEPVDDSDFLNNPGDNTDFDS